MNLYQKLQNARVELQNMKIKKSGKNQNFSYYELSDILPAINLLCKKHKMLTVFDIKMYMETEIARVTVIDADHDTATGNPEPETITFSVPTAEVELPRGQAIQSLGAKITYLRRYLLLNVFEIVENDMVDKINTELLDELSEDDVQSINRTRTLDGLTKVCGKLKKEYGPMLIKPHYDRRKKELETKEKTKKEA